MLLFHGEKVGQNQELKENVVAVECCSKLAQIRHLYSFGAKAINERSILCETKLNNGVHSEDFSNKPTNS